MHERRTVRITLLVDTQQVRLEVRLCDLVLKSHLVNISKSFYTQFCLNFILALLHIIIIIINKYHSGSAQVCAKTPFLIVSRKSNLMPLFTILVPSSSSPSFSPSCPSS